MEGELQLIVGAHIKDIRLTLGLSQEAFAEEFGYHRTYLASIERGERNLSLQSLERLADVLEMDVLELLTPPAPRPARRRR